MSAAGQSRPARPTGGGWSAEAGAVSTWGRRWGAVSNQGRLVRRIRASGTVRYRIDFGWRGERGAKRRVYLDSVPDELGTGRRTFGSESEAQETLERIRAAMTYGRSLEEILSEIHSRNSADQLVEARLRRYLDRFHRRVEAGQRSPVSLRELERYATPKGHFGWWWRRSVQEITNGDVEDWQDWLAMRDIAPKTQRNVSNAFRAFLKWLHRRREIRELPEFPEIQVPTYLPHTLSLESRARVLDAIPWERRGAFLAASWLLMRPREIRAVDLEDYDPERNTLAVFKAFKGPRLDDPIRETKARAAGHREVWETELRNWIAWRLDQATPEARLRGEVALFWCPTARNAAKRWADDPLRQEWNRACKRVGVKVPLYEGTKHTTATALAEGGIQPLVLKALGGWRDSKSVERYAQPKATRAAINRHLPRAS